MRTKLAIAQVTPYAWESGHEVDRDEHRAGVEVFWEGGARTELQLRLNRSGNGPRQLAEDTIAQR